MNMSCATHYKVTYIQNKEFKFFYIFSVLMSNEYAWYMAAVDAGCVAIPKFRQKNLPKMGRYEAERHGISYVTWSAA